MNKDGMFILVCPQISLQKIASLHQLRHFGFRIFRCIDISDRTERESCSVLSVQQGSSFSLIYIMIPSSLLMFFNENKDRIFHLLRSLAIYKFKIFIVQK